MAGNLAQIERLFCLATEQAKNASPDLSKEEIGY
jgi:hypothetical protein